MSNFIKGNDLMLFDASGHSFAFATSHSLSVNAETSDISTKDHGFYGATDVTNLTWEITSDCLYTEEDFDKIFDMMIARNAVDLYFGVKAADELDKDGLTTAGGNYAGKDSIVAWNKGETVYKGKGIITSLQANANTGENATYSVTISGQGALSKATA